MNDLIKHIKAFQDLIQADNKPSLSHIFMPVKCGLCGWHNILLIEGNAETGYLLHDCPNCGESIRSFMCIKPHDLDEGMEWEEGSIEEKVETARLYELWQAHERAFMSRDYEEGNRINKLLFGL